MTGIFGYHLQLVLLLLGVVGHGRAAPNIPHPCSFQSIPATTDLGGGVRGWVYTEPFRAALFEDGAQTVAGQCHKLVFMLQPYIQRSTTTSLDLDRCSQFACTGVIEHGGLYRRYLAWLNETIPRCAC